MCAAADAAPAPAQAAPLAQAVRLRWPLAGDAPALARLLADEGIARMTSRIPHPYALEDADWWIGAQEELRAGGDDFAWMIVSPQDEALGCVGLHRRGGPAFELGYWIGRPYWGQGVATAAARQAMAWAVQNLHADCLIAGHFADNPASGRVLEKLGFAYTGEREDQPCLARQTDVLCLKMRWTAPPGSAPS